MAAHVTRNDPEPFRRPPHVDGLSDLLARRIARGGARVIVSIPPRHGKTKLVVETLPVWALSHFPRWPVLFATYEARFAAELGGRAKRFALEHPETGVRVAKGWRASDSAWQTEEGGGMWSSGVGGPMTGRGAKLLLIDDPIKNPAEAFSSVVQESLWAWWQMTARPRLEPGGSAIVVLHRWAEKDLPGRLLAQMEQGGEPWEVWRLPAIAEDGDLLGRRPGEALWPERYPIAALEALRGGMTSSRWRALFQQDPKPGAGVMFRREWFKIVPEAPTGARWCRFWDFAGSDDVGTSASEDPCWTAGVRVGRYRGEWWIADSRRRRAVGKPIEDLLRETAKEDRAVCGGSIKTRGEVEPGGMARQWLDHLAREVLCGFDFRGEPARESKVRRAEPLAAAAENGHVHLVSGPWVKDFLDEIEAFPDGRFKDQVDAASGAMNELADSDAETLM